MLCEKTIELLKQAPELLNTARVRFGSAFNAVKQRCARWLFSKTPTCMAIGDAGESVCLSITRDDTGALIDSCCSVVLSNGEQVACNYEVSKDMISDKMAPMLSVLDDESYALSFIKELPVCGSN